jgi:hypothetical protein|tara:strand:+ start:347 stop:742 length:396 start_codon:yes stop_codon:yes gene_type:complete
MLRSSRTILALNGVIMILMGLAFIIFAKKITITMFPITITNLEALEVGIVSRYLMGAGSIMIGIILYLARISVKSGGQKLLLGSAIGFLLIFAVALFIFLTDRGNIPIAALIIYPFLSLLSFYVSTRKYQE